MIINCRYCIGWSYDGKIQCVEIALRAQRAGESLTRWLAPLTFTDWSAPRVTSELTNAVVDWGVAHRWRIRREVPSLAGLPGARADRSGYVDVVCERLDGPPIAIEIDQTDKRWSARKLLTEAEAGVVPLWVRWGEPETKPVPVPVALVVVTTTYRLVGPTGRRLYSRAADPQPSSALPPSSSLPQEPPTSTRCKATTKQGQPCPIDPRPSGLCHVHDPAVQCGGRTKKGHICTVATGGGRCKYHLDQPEIDSLPVSWLPDMS